MAPNELSAPGEIFVEVDVKKLPTYSQLRNEVNDIFKNSSWFDRYGVDWCYLIGAIISLPFGLYILKAEGVMAFILGTVILGYYHSIISNKVGHCNAHGGLSPFPLLNDSVSTFATEFVGSYSYHIGVEEHVKGHHPHTNIIGLGDSSTWKVPQLSRIPYLFIAPFVVPFITPIVATTQLLERRYWGHLLKFLCVATLGLIMHVYLLTAVSGFSFWGAVFYLNVYRGVFALPFIHVNIFQHIGLPMYSQKSRPARIYQMSSGVLNLSRNPILDHTFGHSLINCHVEHHLFPKLSDNMCLKIKPVVESYLKKHGLRYNNDSYMSRLADFFNRYEELMVHAPPITHFVGIQ